jgi:hypothetical protein
MFWDGATVHIVAALRAHIEEVLVRAVDDCSRTDRSDIMRRTLALVSRVDAGGQISHLQAFAKRCKDGLKEVQQLDAVTALTEVATSWTGKLDDLNIVQTQLDRAKGATLGSDTAQACVDLREFILRAFLDMSEGQWLQDDLYVHGLKALKSICAFPQVVSTDAFSNRVTSEYMKIVDDIVKLGRKILVAKSEYDGAVTSNKPYKLKVSMLQDWRIAQDAYGNCVVAQKILLDKYGGRCTALAQVL